MLTGSDRAAAVRAAPVPLLALLELPGVRGTAVLLRDRGRGVVVASAGYDCGSMAAGAVLPLDAGLPVTECLRTGRTVVQGSGPSWVAVPLRRGAGTGALLLSLTGPPPGAEEVERLAALAPELAATAPGWQVASRSLPYDQTAGGDLVLCLPDGRGGDWLLAADVCGYGPVAAEVAGRVRAVLQGLAAVAQGPADLLAAADRELRSAVAPAAFVTAVAVHAAGRGLRVATAGHPPPVLLAPTGARLLQAEPGLPLALDVSSQPPLAVAHGELPEDGVLLLHTDGLLDRRSGGGTRSLDVLRLVAGRPLDDLDRLADELTAAAAAAGPAADDASLLLARPLG